MYGTKELANLSAGSISLGTHYLVQVTRTSSSKSKYKTEFTLNTEQEGLACFRSLNIDLGHRKRLVEVIKNAEVVARVLYRVPNAGPRKDTVLD